VPHRRGHGLGCREARRAHPRKELVEPTSGKYRIALAFVAAAKGYPITLTMPETMSLERRKVLAAFGAKLVLTEGPLGMKGAIAKAAEIHRSDPGHYVLLQQFENPANPQIHFETTGPEIWDDTAGQIDVLVSGIGTGGTITGVSRYIKQVRGKAILSVGVGAGSQPHPHPEPQGRAAEARPAQDSGIGAGFIPGTLDLSVVDRIETVSNDEAIDFARRLAKEEGILSGISCGPPVAVAVRLAACPNSKARPSWRSCPTPANAT